MAGARTTSPASSSPFGRQEGRGGVPCRAHSSLFPNQKLAFRMTLAVYLVLTLDSMMTFSAAQSVPLSMPATPSVPAGMPGVVSSSSLPSVAGDGVASPSELPADSMGSSPGGGVPISDTPPSYPLCPFTNLPPHPPARIQQRCMAASNLSCCDDCTEVTLALTTKSKNLTDIVKMIAPGSTSVCELLGEYPRCQHHLEAIICAINCNPDAGNYMTVAGETRTLQFCNETAEDMFASCRNISQFMNDLSASAFLSLLFQYLGPNLGIGKLNTRVVTTPGCYGGPSHTNFPPTSLCCDPVVIPPECKDNITDPDLIAASNATVSQECSNMPIQATQNDNGSKLASSAPSSSSAGRNQAELGGYLLTILLSLWWFMSF